MSERNTRLIIFMVGTAMLISILGFAIIAGVTRSSIEPLVPVATAALGALAGAITQKHFGNVNIEDMSMSTEANPPPVAPATKTEDLEDKTA